MVNLESYGVQELNINEINETSGGWVWIAVAGAVIYVYNNWGDFEKGFKEGVAEFH